MKQIILILFCCVSLMQLMAGPKVKVNGFVELGEIPLDGSYHHRTLTIWNIGDADLVISKIVTTCECTEARCIPETIAPGDSGRIEISYQATGLMDGPFMKRIDLTTNCDYPTVSIRVRGNMFQKPVVEEKPQGRLSVEQEEYNLGTLKKKKYKKQPMTFDVKFKNEGPGELHILSVTSSCECTRVRYLKDVYAENEVGTLTVYFDPTDIAPQEVLRSFVIQTDGVEAEKEILFSAKIEK